MKKLHTATVGNPAMRMPGGLPFPSVLGIIPGIEAGVSAMLFSLKADIEYVHDFCNLLLLQGITPYFYIYHQCICIIHFPPHQ